MLNGILIGKIEKIPVNQLWGNRVKFTDDTANSLRGPGGVLSRGIHFRAIAGRDYDRLTHFFL